MRRRPELIALTAAAWLGAAPLAHGQPGAAAVTDTAAQEESVDGEPTTQEIGTALGVEAGGRTSAGGFLFAGSYLYRLSDEDWLESSVSFTFGTGAAACFRDREDQTVCDHGLVSGFAAEAAGGVRRYFSSQGGFTPFARLLLGVRSVSFSGDDVRGLAIPVLAGAGIRARAADRVYVLGTAHLRAGVGFFNRELAAEPQISAAVAVGVEFTLD